MGFKLWCCATLLASYVLSFLIQFGFFSVAYNHLPGKCTRFSMNGSEDLVVYPNNHVLISSGIFYPNSLEFISTDSGGPSSGIFLLDLNEESPKPVKLVLEGEHMPAEFHPHGMTQWVTTKEGKEELLLYVISHRMEGDVIEAFEYKPKDKKLLHRGTIKDPIYGSINNLVAVGTDQLYITVERYFKNPILQQLELYLRLPLGFVAYFDGERAMKVASEGLKFPNGIEKSKDGRYIFVNELLVGQIVAYTRNKDNTLQRVQTLPIQIAMDNLFVDRETGDLWVALLIQPLKVKDHYKDHSIAVPSKCMRLRTNQGAGLPFDNHTLEEVLSSTGEGGVVSTITTCLYAGGRLVVGTLAQDLMLCDVEYFMY